MPRWPRFAGARDKTLNDCGEKWGIKSRYTDFQQLLQDPNIDAVHINSPIPDHAAQSIAALKAGKHVACTVPMGTTIEECRQIVEAQRQSGKVYMMMETVVYSREYLFVKELYDKGELGASSSSAARTSRTWTAGLITGLGCRPCTTPHIASALAWLFWVS